MTIFSLAWLMLNTRRTNYCALFVLYFPLTSIELVIFNYLLGLLLVSLVQPVILYSCTRQIISDKFIDVPFTYALNNIVISGRLQQLYILWCLAKYKEVMVVISDFTLHLVFCHLTYIPSDFINFPSVFCVNINIYIYK